MLGMTKYSPGDGQESGTHLQCLCACRPNSRADRSPKHHIHFEAYCICARDARLGVRAENRLSTHTDMRL